MRQSQRPEIRGRAKGVARLAELLWRGAKLRVAPADVPALQQALSGEKGGALFQRDEVWIWHSR
jgi:hypothetical protein